MCTWRTCFSAVAVGRRALYDECVIPPFRLLVYRQEMDDVVPTLVDNYSKRYDFWRRSYFARLDHTGSGPFPQLLRTRLLSNGADVGKVGANGVLDIILQLMDSKSGQRFILHFDKRLFNVRRGIHTGKEGTAQPKEAASTERFSAVSPA